MRSSKLILAIWLATNAWAQNLPPQPQAHPSPAARADATRGSAQAAPQNPKAPPAHVQSSQPPVSRKAPPAQRNGRPAPIATRSSRTPAAHYRSPADRLADRSKVARHRSQPAQRSVIRAQGNAKGRDPFVNPIVERKFTPASCAGTGRQCLVVGEIRLQGVVRAPSGYIAVVANGEHTYFLHENDPLADGAVDKITRDSITLHLRTTDPLGRPVTREVTKKLGTPAV
jgi:hypothetical protein